MVPAQRVAHQRRAVEIGKAVGTKPRCKIAPISGREARPLHGRVSRRLRKCLTMEAIIPLLMHLNRYSLRAVLLCDSFHILHLAHY